MGNHRTGRGSAQVYPPVFADYQEIAMERARFRRLVQRALDGLPPEVAAALDNIAVVIAREPSRADLQTAGIEPGDDLFGLYVGTPLPERGGSLQALPDRIVIYQGPL